MNTTKEKHKSTRKRHWLKVLLLDILIFLVVYMAAQWWLGRDAPTGKAINIEARTTSGEEFSLASLQGQPVLLHFWASWCRICRFEHGSIDSIARDHQVITVMTRSGGEAEARKYLAENNISARVILDEDGMLADLYKVRGVPASFIIDADGNIDDMEAGYSSELGLRIRLWLATW